MISIRKEEFVILCEKTSCILHELQFGVHRLGYRQLLLLVPYYALDNNQSLSKELYPCVAKQFDHTSWQSVEHGVRIAILDAWKRRDSTVWNKYFSGIGKVPSNKQFLAIISELIKETPPN